MNRLKTLIQSFPDLRTELIHQMQSDDLSSARVCFQATLTGACIAAGETPDAAAITAITEQAVAFRQQPKLPLTWPGTPTDPNPHQATFKALHKDPSFMPVMQFIASHFADDRQGDTAVDCLITGWLLASGFPRHFWTFSAVMDLGFHARHPQQDDVFQLKKGKTPLILDMTPPTGRARALSPVSSS